MAYYEKVSRQIYGIYLKYIAPEDIVVYSIDEVFIDATSYLSHYNMTAHDLAMTMIREVLYTTGITDVYKRQVMRSSMWTCRFLMLSERNGTPDGRADIGLSCF